MTIKAQKKRDSWERRVRIAFTQEESQRRLNRIYKQEASKVLREYEDWLKRNNYSPLIDLNLYK